VLTDIQIKFFAALAAQRKIELTNDFLAQSKRAVDFAARRREVLEGSQAELLQAQILLHEIELAHRHAEIAFLAAYHELVATAGVANMRPEPLSGELRLQVQAVDWEGTYRQMLATSPELQAAQARVQQACANQRRQQVQAIPNSTILLGAGVDNATDSGFLNVQIDAPIPFHNGNEGNIAAARAEVTRALNEVVRIELSIKARLARVSQQFDFALASVEKYEAEILPKTKETLEFSERAFSEGEFDFVQLFVVRRNYYEAGLRHVEAMANLADAQARLDGLLLDGGLEARDVFSEDDGIREKAFSQQ
jgi:cobalt-zinc-cadmium efflux system outer membrane protein